MTICILGNNLTALTLAKALVNINIQVDVLYNQKNLNHNYSRTIGVTKNNIDFFNKDIINIDKLVWKLKRIEIFTENFKKESLIHFEKDNSQLFSIIRNYELFELLKKDLLKNKYFKKNFLNIDNFSFLKKYELIINCDYSNIISKRYFSKKIIKKYNSYAYTTIIKHNKILNDTAFQIFTQKGPLAFLPISNEETSIVYSIHNSHYQKKENIEKLIKDKNFRYNIKKIERINSFELNSLNLRSYYHKNILAFGDLLHRVHPLAGQGFNMTIRDIKVLLDIIKDRISLGLSIDSSVNSEFQKNAKHKNFIFSNGIDLIHEFFNIDRKLKSNFLSKSVKLIGKYPKINKIFTKIADTGALL